MYLFTDKMMKLVIEFYFLICFWFNCFINYFSLLKYDSLPCADVNWILVDVGCLLFTYLLNIGVDNFETGKYNLSRILVCKVR